MVPFQSGSLCADQSGDPHGTSLGRCRGGQDAAVLLVWRHCEHSLLDGKSWASQQSASQPHDLQVTTYYASLCPFFSQKVQSASQPSDEGSILPATLTEALVADNIVEPLP